MSQTVLITWKGNKTISQTSSETAVKIFAALENLFIGSPPSEFTKTHILPLGYDIRYILIGNIGKVKRFGKADVNCLIRHCMNILIYAAYAVVSFLFVFFTYKLIRFLQAKNIRIPKTIKRILKLLLLIGIVIVIGYFIFTGKQI